MYQLQPDHAYKIRVTRSAGLPKNGGDGKPLQRIELSVELDIPEIGILR